MKTEDKERLCSLIRDHEDSIGSSRVTMLAINAFIESIKQVKCEIGDAQELYAELADAIRGTEPKVIPLIHLIEEFEKELRDSYNHSEEETIESFKEKAIRILQAKHDKIKIKTGKTIEYGLTCISEGDVIIVHTLSSDITNMLKLSREVLQKNFKVIVLKQDLAKTRRLVKSLSAADIDMEIIPEYSLNNYVDQGNKTFMGALSITGDMKAVTAVGSANVVGLCHLNKLPVYLFANTLKFAHQPSSQQKIHRKVQSKTHEDISYQLITHSHDTVDLRHVDFLVTENGVKDKEAILECIKAARNRMNTAENERRQKEEKSLDTKA